MSKQTTLYSWVKVRAWVAEPDLGTKSDEDMRRAADSYRWPNVNCYKWNILGPVTGVLLKNSKASYAGVILPVCTTQEEVEARIAEGVDTFYVTGNFVPPVDPKVVAANEAVEELLSWHRLQEAK